MNFCHAKNYFDFTSLQKSKSTPTNLISTHCNGYSIYSLDKNDRKIKQNFPLNVYRSMTTTVQPSFIEPKKGSSRGFPNQHNLADSNRISLIDKNLWLAASWTILQVPFGLSCTIPTEHFIFVRRRKLS